MHIYVKQIMHFPNFSPENSLYNGIDCRKKKNYPKKDDIFRN